MVGPTTPLTSNANDIIILIRSVFDDSGTKLSQKSIQELSKELKRAEYQTKRFNFGYLSTMFFAMQLQRYFGQILTSGVDTFRKITEATAGTNTAMTGLAAAGEFLKFTIGDALNTVLEPLMPLIIGLVQAFADFVQQHPEVVVGLLVGFFASIAAFQFSQIMLLIQGLKQLGGDAGTIGGLSSIESSITKIGRLAAAGIGFSLVFKGITEFTTDNVLKSLSDTIAGGALIGMAAKKIPLKAGVALIGISTALVVADAVKDSGFSIGNIISALSGAGLNVLLIGAATGNLPLIGIGVALVITDVVWKLAQDIGNAVKSPEFQDLLMTMATKGNVTRMPRWEPETSSYMMPKSEYEKSLQISKLDVNMNFAPGTDGKQAGQQLVSFLNQSTIGYPYVGGG